MMRLPWRDLVLTSGIRWLIWGVAISTWGLGMTLIPTQAMAYGVFQTLQHQTAGFEALDEVESAALSPDGRHLYVGGRNAIMVLGRNQDTGGLVPLQTLESDIDGFDIFFISHLAASPDGQNIYAASTTFGALLVFQRDPATGLLTFIEQINEGSDEIEGLNLVLDLEISTDGRNVYTLAFGEAEIGVFARDLTTGSLTQVEVENDAGDIPQLQLPRGSALAPDGGHFYVADQLGGLLTFSRAADTGELTFESAISNGDELGIRLWNVVLDPSSESLYLAGTNSSMGTVVTTFSRDPSDGGLERIDADFNVEFPTSLLVDATGSNLYITSNAGHIEVFGRDTQGMLTHRQTLSDGIDGVDGLASAGLGVLDPQGRHLYVPSFADEAVSIFSRTASTGDLAFDEVIFDGQGTNPDGLAAIATVDVPVDGQDVYILGQGNQVLAQYRRSPTGTLTLAQVYALKDLGLSPTLNVSRLISSPDGNYLIVVDELKELWIFERDSIGGGLDFLTTERLEDLDPFDIIFSADSRFVLASSDSDLGIWDFDGLSGELSPRLFVSWPDSVFLRIAIGPEGRFIYGGGHTSESAERGIINLFEWDQTTDTLTFLEEVGSPALGRHVSRIRSTSDGRHLIATGFDESDAGPPGLVVFARDAESGRLSEIQTLIDGVDGVSGLKMPFLGDLSASGTRLMVTSNPSFFEPTISNFFARDPETGLLTLLEQRASGDGSGPAALATYGGLTWSPSGDQFYAPGLNSLYAFDQEAAGACVPGPNVLCLGDDGRFKVEVTWADFAGQTGVGTKVTESADSGLFWFFDANNWEMLVKVIDGCSLNNHFWVFAAATTNVSYTLTVTDTQSNTRAVYPNPLGISSPAITDTGALATCQ